MPLSRRRFLSLSAPAIAAPAVLAAAPATDARIDSLTISFEDFLYRAPYKFGGREVDRVTMLNVRCRVSTKAGKSAAMTRQRIGVSSSSGHMPATTRGWLRPGR